jgi:Glycosyl transferases group 1
LGYLMCDNHHSGMRRVTIITQGSEENGSAHFRALQYAPLLRRRGLDVLASPAPVATRRIGGSAGAALLLAEHGGRYLQRTLQLRRSLAESDVVLIQRGAYPVGPSLLLRDVQRFSGRVVYDLDDAVFLATPTLAHRGRLARWAYRDRQSLALLKRADAVIVSTPELAEALPGRSADLVLPTIPDVWAYPTAVHEQAGPLRLGWIGSQGNVRYLDPLREALGRLARERVASLQVVASAPWSGPSTFQSWGRSSEAASVAGFEVGIMPLPESPYTQAKAGFKLLQYMAAGCAVIASPVGVNRTLVEEAHAGMLASTPEEWEAAIRELAADAPRRAALGANGQRFVREFADRDRHTDALAAVLKGEGAPARVDSAR